MTSRGMLRAGVLVAAATLALTGCGSPAPAITAAPMVEPKACGDVTLAESPWVGYQANLAVVSYLLTTELKCTVTVKAEPEADSWKNLAAGKVDAILENWSHDDLKKKYIDTDKVAVEGGLTGIKGVIGWYVPQWMADKYPDITNYKNLNKYAYLFETPASKGKGQLLDADPTYVTYDKNLVRNLKLDYEVVYAGSEAAVIRAFRKADRDETPLLGYFYSPQWLLSEVKLAHVTLPTYTPGCNADVKTITCDYEPYDLDKIMNKQFAYSGSPAAELIRNFQWTADDQNSVALDITVGKLSNNAAAKRWLDANKATWRKWLPAES